MNIMYIPFNKHLRYNIQLSHTHKSTKFCHPCENMIFWNDVHVNKYFNISQFQPSFTEFVSNPDIYKSFAEFSKSKTKQHWYYSHCTTLTNTFHQTLSIFLPFRLRLRFFRQWTNPWSLLLQQRADCPDPSYHLKDTTTNIVIVDKTN